MGRYIVKRLVYMIFVFILLTFLLFLLYQLMPANRAYTDAKAELAGLKNTLSAAEQDTKFQELYLKYQRRYGTDTSNKMILYLRWLGLYPFYDGKCNGIFQGNFGFSYQHNAEVVKVVGPAIRNSMLIGLISEICVLGVTIPLGIKCAVKKNSRFDRGTQVFTLIGFSTPSFIIYILFIVFFCSILGWFPVSGMKTPGSTATGWANVKDVLHHVALPCICLTFGSLASIMRITRASMIDALSLDCIRTARAKGLREKVVIYSHAWRNALIPIVTLVVGWFLGIFGGSLIFENMFGINGMGKLMIQSLRTADTDVIILLQLFYVALSLLGNLIIDIVYGLVDPRVRVNA